MSPISARLLETAQFVLKGAAKSGRADNALREILTEDRSLTQDDRRTVAHTTLAYYRWRGWLPDPTATDFAALRSTAEMAEKFARTPGAFSDEEILERWAPSWANSVMGISAASARAFQTPPLLWLRARPGEREKLEHSLQEVERSPAGFPDALAYVGPDDLYRHPLFYEGAFEIQDLASQAVALLCAPGEKETWWDACAGEGGKTLYLGDLKRNKGLIWSSDNAQWRLDKLKRRAARAKIFNYRVAHWDGGERLPTKTKFDGILVDAPCSGMGTWGRNPHARWTTTPQDVEELARLQLKLLTHAAKGLKPGGKLIYSVCTLAAAECEGVAEKFSAAHAHFAPLPLPQPLSPAPAASHRILPQETRGNAMFIAAWEFKGASSTG